MLHLIKIINLSKWQQRMHKYKENQYKTIEENYIKRQHQNNKIIVKVQTRDTDQFNHITIEEKMN